VSKRLNEVLPVRNALGHLLPLTVGMTVAATAIATPGLRRQTAVVRRALRRPAADPAIHRRRL